MLTWFRKQQSVLAPILVTVFLASTFSLYCRHCRIQLEQIRQALVTVQSDAGHCPLHGGGQPQTTPPAKPCHGNCDCDDHAGLIADKHGTAMRDYRHYSESIILIPPAADRMNYAPGMLDDVIGQPDEPERACYPPLERFCVLLI